MSSKESVQQKHLIVFGLGYVGSRIAEQAMAKGLRVTALLRDREKVRFWENKGVEVVVGVIDESGWHDTMPLDADYVLNCVSGGRKGLEGYERSYVQGNRSLVEWAGKGFKGRLVYTSSSGVYPFTEGEIVDETTIFSPETETAGKLIEAEKMISGSGLSDWAILRLTGIYGKGRHYLLNAILNDVGELSGKGDIWLNLIHVVDVCTAIWQCFDYEDSLQDTFNVSDDLPVIKSDLVEWIAGQCGKPVPVFNSEKTLRVRHLENGKVPNRKISNAKMKQVFGWKPMYPNFKDGYRGLL